MPPSAFDRTMQSFGNAARVRKLAPGVRVGEIVDPAHAPQEAVDALYGQLVALAPACLPGALHDWETYFETELRSGRFPARRRFFLFGGADGALIGFSSYTELHFADAHALFFNLTGLLQEYRGRRVATRTYLNPIARVLLRRPAQPIYLLGLSSNPVVYEMLTRALSVERVFPRPGVEPPAAISAVAGELADWYIRDHREMGFTMPLEFEEQSLILRGGMWPPMPPADRPSSGNAETDAWMRGSLGDLDACLVVARATLWDCVKIGAELAGRRLLHARRRPHQAERPG